MRLEPRVGDEVAAAAGDADHDVGGGAVRGLPALEHERALQARARPPAQDRQDAAAGARPAAAAAPSTCVPSRPLRAEVALRAPQGAGGPDGRSQRREVEARHRPTLVLVCAGAEPLGLDVRLREVRRTARTVGHDDRRRAAASTRAPAIEVEGLHRSFGSVQALRGVDLEVAAGEVHALLGPNGAGKTTLMRILSGLVDPSEGSAYVLDRRAGRSPELRALIGMVPPGDRTFYLRLSGLENLIFFARLHGLRRRAARARALELLEAVGLGDAAHAADQHLLARHAEAALVRARAALRARSCCSSTRPRTTSTRSPPSRSATSRLERGGRRHRGAVGDPADRGAPRLRRSASPCSTAAPSRSRARSPRSPPSAAPTATCSSSGRPPRRRSAALDAALGAPRHACSPAADAGHVLLALAPGVALGAAVAALVGRRRRDRQLPRRAPADRARLPRRDRGARGMSVLVAEARKVPAFMRRDLLVHALLPRGVRGRPASTSASRRSCSASSPS